MDCDQTTLSHSQLIAVLETQVQQQQVVICKNIGIIKDLQQLLVLATDYTKTKNQTSKDLDHICAIIDSLFETLIMNLSHLANFPAAVPVEKSFPEPPFYSHLYFSGDISETHCFCSLVGDTFARLPGHFLSEKQHILWISGYFCNASGKMGEPCPSYTW
jgi:hypothetical protein